MTKKTGKSQRLKLKKRQIGGDLPILEFLKWLCVLSGITGFITWIGDVVYSTSMGNSIHPIFEETFLIGNNEVPYILILFSGVLLLGCGLAALQTHRSRTRFDWMEETMSEIQESHFDAIRKITEDLQDAKRINSKLQAQLEDLTSERDKLNARLKKVQERLERSLSPDLRDVMGIGPKMADRLKELGLEKVSDLLKVSPEELSLKLGVSQKIVSRWFEEVMRLSRSGKTTT